MEKIYGKELNTIQTKVLKYIEEYIKTKGISPSLREISDNTKIKSPTTVKKHLNILEKQGYIKIIESNNRMSGIKIKNGLFEDIELNKRKSKINKIKTAEIPLFGRIYEKNNLFSEINYEELISVPVSRGMEENLFAFKNTSSKYEESGMPKSSIIVVDKKIKPIHGDYVAKYSNGKFDILKYERGQDQDIIGKIIGSYINITY